MDELNDIVKLPSGRDLNLGTYEPGGSDQALVEGVAMSPGQHIFELAPGQRVSLNPDGTATEELTVVEMRPGDETNFRRPYPEEIEQLGLLGENDPIMVVKRHNGETEEYWARTCMLVAATQASAA